MDHTRNHGEAGVDQFAARLGMSWLVALCRKIPGTVPRRDGSADEPRPRVERDLAVIIAKRGLTLHNRDAKGAAKFDRVHHILAKGGK